MSATVRRISFPGGAIFAVEGKNGARLADVPSASRDDEPAAEARARLYAAAPDLLSLVKEGIGGWSNAHGLIRWRERCRAAIARAEGKEAHRA